MRRSLPSPTARLGLFAACLVPAVVLGGCTPPPLKVCTEAYSPFMKLATAAPLPLTLTLLLAFGLIRMIDKLLAIERRRAHLVVAVACTCVYPALWGPVLDVPIAILLWPGLLVLTLHLVLSARRRDQDRPDDSIAGVCVSALVLVCVVGTVRTTRAVSESGRTCHNAVRPSPLPTRPQSPEPSEAPEPPPR